MDHESLGEAIPKECARVREIIGQYKETQAFCPQANCQPAIIMMESALRQADEAMISGNTIAMIRVYNMLKDFE
jgi:hypothetical protein